MTCPTLPTGDVFLYGTVKNLTGVPIPATEVRLRINPSPQYKGSSIISKDDYTFLTNEVGYFEISLVGGIKVTIVIPACNYQVTGITPPSGRISLTEFDKQYTQI